MRVGRWQPLCINLKLHWEKQERLCEIRFPPLQNEIQKSVSRRVGGWNGNWLLAGWVGRIMKYSLLFSLRPVFIFSSCCHSSKFFFRPRVPERERKGNKYEGYYIISTDLEASEQALASYLNLFVIVQRAIARSDLKKQPLFNVESTRNSTTNK